MKKLIAFGLALALSFGCMSAAKADLVLSIDLSVTNQVTVSATGGLSAVSTTGSTTTGFYLDNFFGLPSVDSATLIGTLVSGNLTTANEISDNSPNLYRFNTTDSGFNIWSYTASPFSSFTAGSVAFTGSATFNLDADVYAAALAGGLSGNVFFPADDPSDLPLAQIIGTWSVVPEPTSAALVGLAAIGMVARRRRG